MEGQGEGMESKRGSGGLEKGKEGGRVRGGKVLEK